MQSAKNDTAALKRNQAVLLLFRIFFGSEKMENILMNMIPSIQDKTSFTCKKSLPTGYWLDCEQALHWIIAKRASRERTRERVTRVSFRVTSRDPPKSFVG